MNIVILIGRLTKEPDLKYTAGGMAVCTFTLAIDRPKKDGEKKTDFPRVTVFGKQAENAAQYLSKGRMAGVQGSLTTGSYQDKNGNTIYTTDVIADHVKYLDHGKNEPTPNKEFFGDFDF